MRFGTIFMMVFVLGFVWGGFAYLLYRSVRAEEKKRG